MSNEEILDKNPEEALQADSAEENLQDEGEIEAENGLATEGAALSADELMDKLELAERKATENWDQLLRTKAEMDNIRRRTQKDLENAHKFALEKFISELLAVKDSLELGIDAASQEGARVESLLEGSQMTLSMLSGVFEKFNVLELNPQGEKFNPDHHQAMTMQPSAEHEPNTVITVMQKGYLLNDRLVRPAMVMVSKAAE
ncbi:Heat shock protein GrpE [hydrothermal vent metagenome]|uniref:Heat shock protein GrpE n=1 Tax=hydrothermal vent metagenome TaxID=652676 RepID=A0A3B0Y2X8_9ZZZZ